MLTYRSRPQPMADISPTHADVAPKRRDDRHALRQKIERGFPLDRGVGTASALASSRSVAVHQYRIGSIG
jgi:hypothetical protein